MAIKQYDKYLVIKRDDIVQFLTWAESCQLRTLTEKLDSGRRGEGLPINDYIVCNQDEAYAGKLWELILEGETKKKGFFRRLFRR